MNRRRVLQTLAVVSAGGANMMASGLADAASTSERASLTISATIRQSQELCVTLLSQLDRIETRTTITNGRSSNFPELAAIGLQELSVLLERVEAQLEMAQTHSVAVFQACSDALLRVRTSLLKLSQNGILPHSVVDHSLEVFEQTRQML